MTDLVTNFLSSHPYLGLFVILLICGLGVPLPEDIPLVTSGYFSYLGYSSLWGTMAVAMVGVLVGDTMLFFIGRRLGEGAVRSRFFGKILPPERFRKLQAKFASQGAKVIFFSRFAAGIRGAMFLTAGISGVSYRVFILMDALAALITVPLLVALGNIFGDQIEWIWQMIRSGERVVFVALVMGVVAFVGVKWWGRRRKKRLAAAEAGGQDLEAVGVRPLETEGDLVAAEREGVALETESSSGQESSRLL